MASANNLTITVALEPIVKLTCLNVNCKFHLLVYDWLCCNLKHVDIGEQGECRNYEPKQEVKGNDNDTK